MSGLLEEGRRPPYDPGLLTDLLTLPRNGLTAVSTFSGCGGSSLGLKQAGWTVPYAVEFVAEAARTYRANFPETHVDERDVRDVEGAEILERLGLKSGELDMFEGSPPCSSFSGAGLREKGWGKVKAYSDVRQRTDDLFLEWARLLGALMPRAFIAENVPGLIAGNALGEYAHAITRELGRLGYHVAARVRNASGYGVPQDRRRLIFMGLRKDLPGASTPAFPPYLKSLDGKPYTLQEALDVAAPSREEDLEGGSMEGYAVGRTWHVLREARARGVAVDFPSLPCQRCGEPLDAHRDLVRQERTAQPLPVAEGQVSLGLEGEAPETVADGPVLKARCADGEKAIIVKDYFSLVVPDPEKPSPTVTATGAEAGAASVTHPTECRKMTPEELKAVSGFPPDFILTGSRKQRAERIGRAVPPPMYRVLGESLASSLRK